MGIYISKLGIQALVVSQIATLCSAAPGTTQDIDSADDYALIRNGSLCRISSASYCPKNPSIRNSDMYL
ncbi:hypothetical protein DSO57_1020252 [Entomophthora muscae]|uniref:Uncharacterized protein n=1 Tax=Entomophthora muscae TaxID=34485 RepID=A0ACC2UDI7_9FUNG|nr:hypothetical protein DSO57_1020252 [Entomophthora muscae]